jgi:regulator of nucleoside diphosphate kinase
MTYEPLITTEDARRLDAMAHRLRSNGRNRGDQLLELQHRVGVARLVEPATVPDDVVTLNSRVRLRDLGSGRRIEVVLADPLNIALFGDQLSVAGPCGVAVLGRRVGDVVDWVLGPKRRKVRIERLLYQPEAAGDFHL